ncbi:S8 family peptidase [Denitrobaculum tricleocarpae]|uniref:S8 family peptidase n=2 Tax=Denitrobaculum tricleocarpae TaxID=2591009 RepID=A0A545SSU5_9PROT|nr:S8 family peptidase [Denitrobaculum tricleocarpae]
MEQDWEGLGLTVLSTDDDNTLVLFASTYDLEEFRARLDAYDGPIPDEQQNRRYAGFVDRIGDVGTIEPRDRLGVRAREDGFVNVDDFQDDTEYVVDIELWEFGPQATRRTLAERIIRWVEDQDGELYDHYSGPSITIIRVKTFGSTIRPILAIPQVAFVDFPPEPDITTDPPEEYAIDDVPPVAPLPDDLPVIAVLDTGVNDHPLLVDAIVAREAFPAELGDADMNGHGTAVAGVAVFGDLRNQLDGLELQPAARIISAKVVTDQAQFYDRRTLPTQMRITIERLRRNYDCRIFVLSLGDIKANFERGRVGPWAATLDELARELDILIFVSAGNRDPRGGTRLEQAITQYPGYLLENGNRVCEPAGAVNALTVGSIAHSNGLGPQHLFDAHTQAITEPDEPSPFSRAGPGAGGIKKPDFVDYGGTLVFDGVAARLQRAPALPNAGVLTTNADFLRQAVVSKTGTSFSAPHLANKAAQVLRRHPDASANLVKALMASSARVPEAALRRLNGVAEAEQDQVLGNGLVSPAAAAFSDDHRVVLYAEDSLGMDQFAVYQVPIPAEFQGNGRRWVRVSLAFDPPVKRTRAEYTGTRMNYRLIRGCQIDEVFEHFRSHIGEATGAPDMQSRFNCALKPGPMRRDRNTLQTSSVKFTQDTVQYGTDYYLVVRCVGGWAAEQEVRQNYAIVVELEHEAQVQLYARIQERVRLRL